MKAKPGSSARKRAASWTALFSAATKAATSEPSGGLPLPGRKHPAEPLTRIPARTLKQSARGATAETSHSPAARPAARSGRPSPATAEARALVSFTRGHAYEDGAGERRAPAFRDCGSLGRNRKRRACRQSRASPRAGAPTGVTADAIHLVSADSRADEPLPCFLCSAGKRVPRPPSRGKQVPRRPTRFRIAIHHRTSVTRLRSPTGMWTASSH